VEIIMKLRLPVLVAMTGAMTLAGGMAYSYAAEPLPSNVKTSGTAPPAVSASISDCDVSQVVLTAGQVDQAAGNITVPLHLTNQHVKAACKIPGRLTIRVVNDNNDTMATATTSGPARTVVLRAKQTYTTMLRTAANTGAGRSCTSPGQIQFDVPGHAAQTTANETRGIKVAACGTVALSPLQRGN
jgi:hypothetical protein